MMARDPESKAKWMDVISAQGLELVVPAYLKAVDGMEYTSRHG